MLDLSKIDLGKDEAEQDERLKEYFLKTTSYNNALTGKKTIIVGRKGSGKSAIFTLVQEELESQGAIVIAITPNEYHWKMLIDYKEQGISGIQAHINVWKATLLFSTIRQLFEKGKIHQSSELPKYYKYTRDAEYDISQENHLESILDYAKKFISGIKINGSGIDLKQGHTPIPTNLISKLINCLTTEWTNYTDWDDHKPPLVRIVIDRLDDNWDASSDSKDLIIGLLKAANELNRIFTDKILTTIFLRSDIYDCLYFNDQDKLRQYEEILTWDNDELKNVICERVKVSLDVQNNDNQVIWNQLFSTQSYRSKASAEKYIIDRTFKRPRDIVSFIRFALEYAVENKSQCIENKDIRLAEEKKYSQSKYKDLIIEYQKQIPYIKDLLDLFSGSLHRQSKQEIETLINGFTNKREVQLSSNQLIVQLFIWGVIGITALSSYMEYTNIARILT